MVNHFLSCVSQDLSNLGIVTSLMNVNVEN